MHTLAQIPSALAEAHDIGLIHRDVKPREHVRTNVRTKNAGPHAAG